jgi:hypothetical protein
MARIKAMGVSARVGWLGFAIGGLILAGFATRLTQDVATKSLSLGHNAVIGKTR